MNETEIELRHKSFLLFWGALYDLENFSAILRVVDSDYFEQNNDVDIVYLFINDKTYNFDDLSIHQNISNLKIINYILEECLSGKIRIETSNIIKEKLKLSNFQKNNTLYELFKMFKSVVGGFESNEEKYLFVFDELNEKNIKQMETITEKIIKKRKSSVHWEDTEMIEEYMYSVLSKNEILVDPIFKELETNENDLLWNKNHFTETTIFKNRCCFPDLNVHSHISLLKKSSYGTKYLYQMLRKKSYFFERHFKGYKCKMKQILIEPQLFTKLKEIFGQDFLLMFPRKSKSINIINPNFI